MLDLNPKGTILIDAVGKTETGVAIEIFETKSDKYLFDGWSLDVFGSTESAGIGIAKDIYKNDFVELDAGVYATKRLNDFFASPIDIRVGFSGTIRF